MPTNRNFAAGDASNRVIHGKPPALRSVYLRVPIECPFPVAPTMVISEDVR
jgi:hypothetical protein